jgi:glycosyltransferase involved in cell wall biosynthesis
MKVALLSFEYPPETGFGGIATYTWYQARALAKLGHEVHVLAGATEPTPLRGSEHDGVRVHRFHADGLLRKATQKLDRFELFWTKNRLQNGLSMYEGLVQLTRKHRYDVVEMPECGAEGLLVNHLTRIPTIVRFHSPSRLIMPYYDVRPADMRLCSLFERAAMRGARAFSCCSEFLASEVQQKLGVRSSIRVIPNGIDLELFDTAEQVDVRERFHLPRDRTLILFAGRMERRKGIHLCDEIAASILERHNVAFALAGRDLFYYVRDRLLPRLEGKTLRGSVHYLGDLDLTTVRSCLLQADIFLIPSLWENCPYACLEAMAAGRAIVSSDHGGMPELIQEGVNGLLARSGEAQSYVRALEALIEDSPLRERLGAAARRTIETRFTDVRIAEMSVAYYRECMGI